MRAFKKILLASDFSPGARWAEAYARKIAAVSGAELHTVYADVLHSDALVGAADLPSGPESAMIELERLTSEAEARDGIDLHVEHAVVRNISAAPAILDFSLEEKVDLIVMGTHGRWGMRRLLLGSVAEEVVRDARCPVLTVHTRDDEPPEHIEIGSILVPVSFSGHSRHAVRYAAELAQLLKVPLDLLHVVEETLHPAFYGLTVHSIYDVQPDIEKRSVSRMREMMAGLDVSAEFEARPGTTVAKIIEYAAERNSGLIVMGMRGRKGLRTTERVVRRAACPVFSIKGLGHSLLPSS